MHITLQSVLQALTLISLIVGFLGVFNTINNYRRQMTVQILMKYTERYEHILDKFPEDALDARFDAGILPQESFRLKAHN